MGEEREKEIFIDETAEKVFTWLSPEDKKYMAEHPDPIKYHFGLGMEIRNEFIHGKDLGWWAMFPDDLSGEIVRKVIELCKERT